MSGLITPYSVCTPQQPGTEKQLPHVRYLSEHTGCGRVPETLDTYSGQGRGGMDGWFHCAYRWCCALELILPQALFVKGEVGGQARRGRRWVLILVL